MVTPELLLINSRTLVLFMVLLVALYYTSSKVRIPLNKRMPKDMLRLKQIVNQFVSQLIPWEKNEIELLSLNKVNVKSSQKNGFESTGAFASIYQEPLFSYGYREYPTKETYSVLYAQTKENELFFYEYPKEVEVLVNGAALGRLIDGKLYGTDGSMLANFLENNLESYTTVVIGNKDAGHILRKDGYNNDVNPRALDLVSNQMKGNENVIFLAMCIWKIVKENVR